MRLDAGQSTHAGTQAISPDATCDLPTIVSAVPRWCEYTSGYDALTYVTTLIDSTVAAFGRPWTRPAPNPPCFPRFTPKHDFNTVL